MVESNNAEERLARIEDMLQAVQREAAVIKTTTARIIDVVQVTLAHKIPRKSRRSALTRSSQRRGSRPAETTLCATAHSAVMRRA